MGDNDKLAKRPPIEMGQRGISITTFDELQRFAQAVAKSAFCPQGMSLESVIVGMQFCMELGLNPVTGLQYISVINGRPALYGDAVVALCMTKPEFDHSAFIEEFERSEEGVLIGASCTVRRKPDGNPVTRSFRLCDAKQAGLISKKGPWQQYPGRMLQWRARHWAFRDAFPDMLRGFSVIDEQTGEVIDGPDVVAEAQPETDQTATTGSGMEELKARLKVKQDDPDMVGHETQELSNE